MTVTDLELNKQILNKHFADVWDPDSEVKVDLLYLLIWWGFNWHEMMIIPKITLTLMILDPQKQWSDASHLLDKIFVDLCLTQRHKLFS